MMPIWYLISEEARVKLRALLPKRWKPPADPWNPVTLESEVESLEEISHLMTQPTKGRKVLR